MRRMKHTVLGLLLVVVIPAPSAGEERPNVLLVLCDQLVPFLTGTYGHPVVRTPHLDRLAGQGIRFETVYTPNPICAPSRACLLTGKYSSTIGVYDNAALLPGDEPTMAHYFSHAGYETVLSGKMHYVGPDQLHGFEKRFLPNIYPADFEWAKQRFGKVPRSHARSYRGDAIRVVPSGVDLKRDSEDRLRIRPADLSDLKGSGEVQSGFNESSHNSQYDRVAHTMALRYIRERGRKGTAGRDAEPFFLCVSYNYPHEPFHPPKELWDLYEGENIIVPEFPGDLESSYSVMDRWLNRHHGLDSYEVRDPESIRKVRRAYYALVTFVDLMVGELLMALEDAGLEKQTLVVFASDHGDMLCEKGMVQKRSFYEWSVRVPMIFRMPDGSFGGTVVEEPVSLVDILPTLLEICRIDHPAATHIEGESLRPYMDGTLKRVTPVYSETPTEGVFAPCFMVRSGNFKYNYFHGYGAQLFDLSGDPGEWHNLSGRTGYMEVENELHRLITGRFDPVRIEKQVTRSLQNRLLIREVMKEQGIDWDYMQD